MRFFPLFFLIFSTLSAQNLVINGGFEREAPNQAGIWKSKVRSCSFSSNPDIINTCVTGWKTFDQQTPDLIVSDSGVACPNFPTAYKGRRMVGLIMYHPFTDGNQATDYHELVSGTLKKPLEVGKTYRISVRVYSDDSLGVRHLRQVYGKAALPPTATELAADRNNTRIQGVECGNFGFHFSEGPINTRENFWQSQLDFPLKPQVNYADIVRTNGQWQTLNMSFTARHPYQYFLFGNFFSDGVTPINMDAAQREKIDQSNAALPFWKKIKRIGYYCFDDFSIQEIKETDLEKTILKDKKLSLEAALLFDTGLSELRTEAQPVVGQLADMLLRNPTLQIEIGGHTDNIGGTNSNQILSEARARSVHDALLSRQIPSTQIRWHGYGENVPIAPNDTEAGRQKNRRVEISIK
jgi:outer membrane protein OmpA-like peptidoglycan-associated protein